MKRRYKRYFIMLEPEDKDFDVLASGETKGYAKVEVRNGQGLLSIYCQNLRSSDYNRYLWYLINTKTDGAPVVVEIGPMEVDGKGKGETAYEIDTENVKGSMEQIDNFNVLVLIAQSRDEKDELYVPLIGYIDKKRPDAGDWRYALGKYLNVPLDKKTTEKKAKRVRQPVIKDTEEIGKETGEEITEKAVEKVIEEIAEESMGKIMDETVETKKEIKWKVVEDTVSIETEENEYEAQMQAYIENSLRSFSKVEPFVEGPKNYTWWQIPYNTQTMYRAYMPFISYLDSLKDPMDYYVPRMLQTIYIHQHHIFGICYDENNKAMCYAYGILGRNLFSEQPFEFDKDLVYWYPCNNVPINIESYGYWILTVDPKTGNAIKYENDENA